MAKKFTSKIGLKPIFSTQDPNGNAPTLGEISVQIVRDNYEIIEEHLQTATSSAGTALSNSETAKTEANQAKTAAQDASTKAGEATTTANEAKTTSENAISTANNANETANQAKSTADDAKEMASQAIQEIGEIDLSPYAKTSTDEGKLVRTPDGKLDMSAKADGCRLTEDNKLQLTSGSADIGAPLELPTGILNLSYKDNKEYEDNLTARKSVKGNDRILGQIITYKLDDGMWILDQFIGESVASWESEGSWVNYALVRDLSPFLLDLESVKAQIDGIDASIKSKIDGGYTEDLDEETIELVLTSNGEDVSRIQLPKGGGGGGTGPAGVVMRLKAVGSTSLVVGENSDAIIKYNWTSIDQETGDDTGSGTVYITINGIPVYSGETHQGDNVYNLKGRLNLGSNNVTVRVTDGYNNVRSVSFRVQKASLILTSTFADDMLYKSLPVAFRYTPIGTGSKAIRFWLNDVEIASEVTTASGKQLTKNLTNLVPGNNSIQVIAEANVDGSQLTSNELYYEFIYADASIKDPVITISYRKKEIDQFQIIEIPYLVYDPSSINANVEILVNGVVVQELQVQRVRQYWSYAAYEQGHYKMEVRCKGVSKFIEFDVMPSEYDIAEEKGDLKYKASAIGKSNSSSNRASWKYGNYDAVFKNFIWQEDGWHKDSAGNNHLRLVGEASVDIGITPFNMYTLSDGATITIEYATENVANFDAPIIYSMFNGIGIEITPSSIKLKSAQSVLSAKVDSSVKTSITFVIQKLASKRLLTLFIDGVMSGTLQYSQSDNFAQSPVQNLTLTSANICTAMIYGIRWYTNDLNYTQVLGNYIFDMENIDEKFAVYKRNNIIDDYGSIDYNLVLDQVPCLTIIGDLPTYKGDKKVCSTVYEDRQNPLQSFTADDVDYDVQGESSQDYPRKNFKPKYKGGFTLTASGTKQNKYALADGQIAVDVFCLKTQFIESSCANDTGLANTADQVLRKLGYLTPPQKNNPLVRTTIFGKPILVYHKKTQSSQAEFIGKYSLNNDKSTAETFGFTPGCESWEFLNNTSDRSLFKSANFEGNEWKNDFTPRYPDGNTDVSNMRKVFEWVLSCKGNPTKFKAECKNHFNEKWLVFYCLWTEVTASVDARAKNQFLTTFGEVGPTGELIWYFLLYDLKTTLGINNEGHAQFSYDVESQDSFGSGHVWNGWDSVLWTLVETAYANEIQALYQEMRQKNILSADIILKNIQDDVVSKWSESVYNEDGYYKYIDILMKEGNGAYLYALQGSRTKHRVWWVRNRFAYLDGKYRAGDYLTDFATMRIYTPKTWQGVPPNADFDITLEKPGYIQIRYGSYLTLPIRGMAGSTYKISAPKVTFNDTETVIYGISNISSLGNLASKYAGTVDVTKARSIADLTLGSAISGYVNTNLTVLHTGSNEMLRTLDITNCVNLAQAIDLTKCYSLVWVSARYSKITAVLLPASGVITSLVLPETITSLIVKNQPNLRDLTTYYSADKINTLVLENLPALPYNNNLWIMARNILNRPGTQLSKVRLIGVEGTESNQSIIMKFTKLAGEDENGNPIEQSVIEGKLHVDYMSLYSKNLLKSIYPRLAVTYTNILDAIEFEDPIVRREAIAKYDTIGLNDIRIPDVQSEVLTFSADILQNSGMRYFPEARFWGRVDLNGCPTLEKLGMKPYGYMSGTAGYSVISNMPKLKELTVYDDYTGNLPYFGSHNVTNCYSIEKFILTGKYIETAQKGAILCRVPDSGGVENLYQFCLPLLNYSFITIDEKLTMQYNSHNATYKWAKDLKHLTLNNVRNVVVPPFEALETLTINGFSENGGNVLQISQVSPTLRKVVIDDKTGNSLKTLTIANIANSSLDIEIKSLMCDKEYQSVFTMSSSNGSIPKIDLPATYIPQSMVISGKPFATGASLIVRSPELIPLTSSLSAELIDSFTLYVPDHLVNIYKVTTNWLTMGNKIKPISELN